MVKQFINYHSLFINYKIFFFELKTEDKVFNGINVRVYTPKNSDSLRNKPFMIYFHGG